MRDGRQIGLLHEPAAIDLDSRNSPIDHRDITAPILWTGFASAYLDRTWDVAQRDEKTVGTRVRSHGKLRRIWLDPTTRGHGRLLWMGTGPW